MYKGGVIVAGLWGSILLAISVTSLPRNTATSDYNAVKCAVSYHLNGRVPLDSFAMQLFRDDLRLRVRLVIGPRHTNQFYVHKNNDRDYTLYFNSDILCREVLSSDSINAFFRSSGVYIGTNPARQSFSDLFRQR